MAALTDGSMTLLSNHCGCIIRDLGLEDRGEERRGTVAKPAAFFVDSDGVVQFQYLGRSPEDRPLLELLKLAASNMPQQSRDTAR